MTTKEPEVGDYVFRDAGAWTQPADGRRAGIVSRIVKRTPTTITLDTDEVIRAERYQGCKDPWQRLRYVSAAEGERWSAVRRAYVVAKNAWHAAMPKGVRWVKRRWGSEECEGIVDPPASADPLTPERCEAMAALYTACAAWLRARPVETDDLLVSVDE